MPQTTRKIPTIHYRAENQNMHRSPAIIASMPSVVLLTLNDMIATS